MSSKLSKTHHLHGIRVILFGVLLIALCLVRIDFRSFATASPQGNVLAYATNMSVSDLTTYTNSARSANGLGNLSLNGKLNSSAQSKANDMIARDYWSHNTPDGVQPWWFFTQAGYSYSNAGENLAYGFSDSSSTVDAWMNSPGHRANILGSYTEVGFGIASGANYQGGENTVVVAHYATPASPPPAPAPAAPVAPTPQTQSAQPAPAPTPTETPAPTPTTTTPTQETPKPTDKQKPATQPPVNTSETASDVPLWKSFQGGTVPIVAAISLFLLSAAGVGYGLTHRSLVRHAVITGEQYALHHPLVDLTVLATVTLLVLLTTTGRLL
jgi:hypothetical protein